MVHYGSTQVIQGRLLMVLHTMESFRDTFEKKKSPDYVDGLEKSGIKQMRAYLMTMCFSSLKSLQLLLFCVCSRVASFQC